MEYGCDVNAQDSDGWTPLHCAASCNNLAMVKFLVESGACLFASTLSDHETPAEKCEEDEEGFDGCSEYLYSKCLSCRITHHHFARKLCILIMAVFAAFCTIIALARRELSSHPIIIFSIRKSILITLQISGFPQAFKRSLAF